MSSLHTYSVCAYGESAFLEECILSVLNQNYESEVLVCTSTPNEHIQNLTEKYQLELHINDESLGIAADWDYALSQATTPLVTIAHQDDVYCPEYASRMVEMFEHGNDALILFSDYGELRGDERVTVNMNLRIKRLLMSSLKRKGSIRSLPEKRKLLRFGSPISCPAVTYNMRNIQQPVFDTDFKCSLDWRAWQTLSEEEGAFCFCPEVLMFHRIHEDSETSVSISNNVRTNEDYRMLLKYWPRPIAKLVNKVYAISQRGNG